MATIKKACKGVSYPKSSSVSKRLGSPSKAKSGGSFPDLNKDGKITKKDILIGKGVLPKTAKKGGKVKKAQIGTKLTKFIEDVGSKGTKAVVEGAKRIGAGLGVDSWKKDIAKSDSIYNDQLQKKATQDLQKKKTVQKNKKGGVTKKTMKMGGKTKKCAYGCK